MPRYVLFDLIILDKNNDDETTFLTYQKSCVSSVSKLLSFPLIMLNLLARAIVRAQQCTSNSYTMVCPPVRGDYPR